MKDNIKQVLFNSLIVWILFCGIPFVRYCFFNTGNLQEMLKFLLVNTLVIIAVDIAYVLILKRVNRA